MQRVSPAGLATRGLQDRQGTDLRGLLSEYVLHDMAVDIGQSEVSARVVIGQSFMIKA